MSIHKDYNKGVGVSVFDYKDYRMYLKDYYAYHKSSKAAFSYRFFAKKAGLKSGNYLKLVMDGSRNITHKTVIKFSKGLSLNKWEALYFENLVFCNQSDSQEEKDFYTKNMKLAKMQNERGFLAKDQYEVISNWYPLAIKELALVDDFHLSGKWISEKFDNQISIEEVKDAISLLERLQLIRVDHENKKINITQQSLQTPDMEELGATRIFHKKILEMATQAIEKQKVEHRCFSALTVAISKDDLPKAFEKIHQFRNEMDSFFMKKKRYNAVYELAIQLFRLDIDV